MPLTAVLLAALLVAAAAATAQETDQFYLIAVVAPLGSISAAGQGATGVYLRWDALEGALPPDLVELELLRDGTPLGVFPAAGTLDDGSIAALYAGPENQRRLLELVRWLAEEDPDAAVSPVDFAGALRQRILDVPPRAVFASRLDFLLARARFRAWLDTGLTNGPHEYELRGHFSGGESVRLGFVAINVDGLPDVAPAAAAFKQVSLGRCDAPEGGKDHHTVALNWQHGGDSAAARFANELVIGGYDLYRTVENVDDVPVRDLRAEAAVAPHDGFGRVALAGLELVSDQPLLTSGAVETETRYAGFNPEFARFFETQDELLAHGLMPGDRRAYYLVARDLSAN
jgi:hypothetical protein